MSRLTAQLHSSINDLCSADQWQQLTGQENPFTRHAFLQALEQHAAVDKELGWLPQHIGIYADDKLQAACAGYLTSHSFGDFVYDWNWAQIAAQQGIDWYPKWVIEVPYSPVTGSRLQCGESHSRWHAITADTLIEIAQQQQLPCVQVNYCSAIEARALADAGFIIRSDMQLHWQNNGYQDFTDFLAELSSKRRKETRRERRKVVAQGITHRWVSGSDSTSEERRFIHACYHKTFSEYGNHPALTIGFFDDISQSLGDQVQFCLAEFNEQKVACAIFLRSASHLYGRYWGALAAIDCLHFETCFYQGIEYCIKNGLQRFEPGAGGGHKLNRGFLPAPIYTAHYVRDPVLRSLLEQVALEEQAFSEDNQARIKLHSPMRNS